MICFSLPTIPPSIPSSHLPCLLSLPSQCSLYLHPSPLPSNLTTPLNPRHSPHRSSQPSPLPSPLPSTLTTPFNPHHSLQPSTLTTPLTLTLPLLPSLLSHLQATGDSDKLIPSAFCRLSQYLSEVEFKNSLPSSCCSSVIVIVIVVLLLLSWL